MFGADPINVADPTPYLPLAYYGHLVIGSLAIVASLIALASRKGSTNHRRAGFVYIFAVLLVCASSISMFTNVFIAPLFMAVFTALYAIGGAWLALRPGTARVRLAEAALSLFEIAGLTVFLSIAIPAVQQGIIPLAAPMVIAAIPVIMLAGDVNWFVKRADRAKLRIARHMSRMIWGFVVVLRAPLVELVAGGLPLPAPVVVVGPILLGFAMLFWFGRKYRTPAARSV